MCDLELNTFEDIALNAQEVVRGSLDDHLTSVLITAFVQSRTATSTYRIWRNDMVAHIAFQTSLYLENRSKTLQEPALPLSWRLADSAVAISRAVLRSRVVRRMQAWGRSWLAVQYCYRIIKAGAAHLRGQKRIGTVLFVFMSMRVVELFMKPDSLNLLPT